MMTEKEDRLLEAQIQDRIRQCSDRYMITTSAFLDPRGRSLAEKVIRAGGSPGVHSGFYGGYPDAERVIAVFLPEYIEEPADRYFAREPAEDPLTVLRVSLKKGAPELSHRDYLGALMGLGIRRESTGDILVRRDGADLIVLKEMADFIRMNMDKAGRARLEVEEIPVSELMVPEVHRTEVSASVSSLRLDSVLGAAFGLSRAKALEAIAAGLVSVNGAAASKPEKQVAEGDKLVLRGRGKVIFRQIRGSSSKGRTIIALEKFR